MDARIRQLWIEKIGTLCQQENWEYAQFLCMEMLYEEPNYIDARRTLYRAVQHTYPKQKLRRWCVICVLFFKALWYLLKIKTKYRELIESMDELINTSPHNASFLRLFGEVMSSFSFYETTIFSIECISENQRDDADLLLLGEAFSGSGDYTMAIDMANKVLARSPDNVRARDLLWQASVEQSMGTENP